MNCKKWGQSRLHCHLDDEEQGAKKQNKSPAEEYAPLISFQTKNFDVLQLG